HDRHIGGVGSSGCQSDRKGMFPNKRPGCQRMEAVLFQNISQLDKGVIEMSVSINDHGDGQSLSALYRSQIFQQNIGNASRIDGRTEYDQRIRIKTSNG